VTVVRVLIALLSLAVGIVMGVGPVSALANIARLWWKWHDVPGASIHNLEEINYTIFGQYFANGALMYVVISSQLMLASFFLILGGWFLVAQSKRT
jgi:hypothetical protein